MRNRLPIESQAVVDQLETTNRLTLAIPGYTIYECIGQGGMGSVYRAMQLSLERMVAIKVLHPSSSGTPPAFQRESRLMASLTHPNVVAIHDTGRAGDHSYLVTELVVGHSLRVAMKPEEAWPVRRALPVLDGIAAALSYIHGQGILHLDLKPENVLCPESGGVKIADFGLALAQVDARQLAERGLAQGTIDYCAPEQRHGLKTDPRSDLFSFAVVAYELLTGEVPARTFQPPSQVNPKLPKAADAVFQRALARKPHERYPTVAEFHDELRQAFRSHLWTGVELLVVIAALLLAALLIGSFARAIEPAPEPATRVWLLHDEPATASFFQARVTLPHKLIASEHDAEARDYWTVNWFTPTREWQTYILVWDWPPFEAGTRGRNLEIIFAGLGKAWLDDMELFTWE